MGKNEGYLGKAEAGKARRRSKQVLRTGVAKNYKKQTLAIKEENAQHS